MEPNLGKKAQTLGDTANIWDSMVASLGGGVDWVGPQPQELQAQEVPVEVIKQSETSQGDGFAQSEQNQEDLDARLAAENGEHMRQSEAEMEAFQRRLEMSPEAYWSELRNEYAQKGVNLGLMPDVRGMREYAEEYLAENVGNNDQAERIGIALKTEMSRMAESKAEEIQKWQSEGRGLPITFESEWLESSKRDMGNILDAYYGAEKRLGEQAKGSDELTDDEKVAWQMAALPQKPGKLNPIYVVRDDAGRFEGESALEYYNRLKNYRAQDLMRDWQLRQDEGRQVAKAEEPEKVDAEGETVRAWEQIERDPEGVEEAIRETDKDVELMRDEQETGVHQEMVERIVKNPSFGMWIKYLLGKSLDTMGIKDTPEEDEAYYAEMERQERLEAQKIAEETDGVVEEIPERKTVEELREALFLKERAEKALQSEDLSEEARESLTRRRDEFEKTLEDEREMYGMDRIIEAQTLRALHERETGEVSEEMVQLADEKAKFELEKELAGKMAFDVLRDKRLILGNMGEGSAKELEDLRKRIENELVLAARDGDETAVNEYFEITREISQVMEWLGVKPGQRELDVIPVERPQVGEMTGGGSGTEGAVA